MNSLGACNITKFEDLLHVSDDFGEFKQAVAPGQFDETVTDRLFICIRLIKKS